jgi:cytochrome c
MRVLKRVVLHAILTGSAFAQAVDPCLTVADTEIRKVLITSSLTNPLEIAVAPDKRIFVIEKVSGRIRIVDPVTKQISEAGRVAVFGSAAHTGLLGIALDPAFASNHFVYVYYAHENQAKHELVRFTESAGLLPDASKVVLLTVPGVRWSSQHHSAGSLAFGPDGNLYIATGENVDPTLSQGYASTNEAARLEDTQATSANTNDLNGKILRIRPLADGTYAIPEGNLFATSTKTRGEIYAMGMRNPFRIAIDSKTGWLYWGEPGPDATSDNASRGPEGRDEINRAKAPGFFGWPYFIADNLAYTVNGSKKDPARPVNRSPNNTGDTLLPTAQPALLAYTDRAHAQYPAFGVNGARASILGGVYRFNAAQLSPNRLPPRFDGSLFIMDWSRDWINEVTFNAEGTVTGVKPFLASQSPNGPIDMAFGPDGDMYLLEYDANSLYQVQYTGACKMDDPVAVRSMQKHAQALRPNLRPASGWSSGRRGLLMPPEAYVGKQAGKWLGESEDKGMRF